jgi:hypothetical protein
MDTENDRNVKKSNLRLGIDKKRKKCVEMKEIFEIFFDLYKIF